MTVPLGGCREATVTAGHSGSGCGVGACVGSTDGAAVGSELGWAEGADDGCALGLTVGCVVGDVVGASVGRTGGVRQRGALGSGDVANRLGSGSLRHAGRLVMCAA